MCDGRSPLVSKVFERLAANYKEREADRVDSITTLLYKRVSGLTLVEAKDYAHLFEDVLKTNRLVVSSIKPECEHDFAFLNLNRVDTPFDQLIEILLVLEDLLSTQLSVYKRIDTNAKQVHFVTIEPIGDGSLMRALSA